MIVKLFVSLSCVSVNSLKYFINGSVSENASWLWISRRGTEPNDDKYPNRQLPDKNTFTNIHDLQNNINTFGRPANVYTLELQDYVININSNYPETNTNSNT